LTKLATYDIKNIHLNLLIKHQYGQKNQLPNVVFGICDSKLYFFWESGWFFNVQENIIKYL